jgi:hypothetical protein
LENEGDRKHTHFREGELLPLRSNHV